VIEYARDLLRCKSPVPASRPLARLRANGCMLSTV